MKVYIVNVKESVDRRTSVLEGLSTHGVPEKDIEIVHPLMVRDCASQDDWCEKTKMKIFKKLKGRPPLIQISYLHTYMLCLSKIKEYTDPEETALILEDDYILNRPWDEINDVIEALYEDNETESLLVQLSSWLFEDMDPLTENLRVEGTSFYRGLHNGSAANVFNAMAAEMLYKELEKQIPLHYSEGDLFAVDTHLGEHLRYNKGCYTIANGATYYFHEKEFESEYLKPGGELILRDEHLANNQRPAAAETTAS